MTTKNIQKYSDNIYDICQKYIEILNVCTNGRKQH